VILVLDAGALARTAAAIVLGFETFDPELRLAAVIANRVAGPGHYLFLEEAIRASCKTLPAGWLPVNPAIEMPSRHLGLVMCDETMDEARIGLLADWVEQGLDLDRVWDLSLTAVDCQPEPARRRVPPTLPRESVRIGIALDASFCFYYQDNLDLLEQFGAELVPWSPMADNLPEGLQGLYFGGGYPELFSSELSANSRARQAVQSFVVRQGFVYAECGGLMYLTEAIVNERGEELPMTAVLPAKSRMCGRLAALGYFEVRGTDGNELLPPGQSIRGHQFRYSDIGPLPDSVRRQYIVRSPANNESEFLEGYRIGNCLASYIHLHFLSNGGFAARWLDQCRRSNVYT